MYNGIFNIPKPANEPCLQYSPGTPERAELTAKLKEMLKNDFGREHYSDTGVIYGANEVEKVLR